MCALRGLYIYLNSVNKLQDVYTTLASPFPPRRHFRRPKMMDIFVVFFIVCTRTFFHSDRLITKRNENGKAMFFSSKWKNSYSLLFCNRKQFYFRNQSLSTCRKYIAPNNNEQQQQQKNITVPNVFSVHTKSFVSERPLELARSRVNVFEMFTQLFGRLFSSRVLSISLLFPTKKSFEES